jgi:hypothetical protein
VLGVCRAVAVYALAEAAGFTVATAHAGKPERLRVLDRRSPMLAAARPA